MSRIPGWTKVSKAVGWALAHQIQYLSLALRLALFAGVALCAQLAGPAWAGVIYVRADATGTNNGHSWANAYTDLQAALAAAEWGDEIWVAQGTYKPTTGTDRNISFALEAGTGLYGGFAGTETDRAQRNWETNATILSGDIGTTDTADNSYHVVTGANLAVLDGFTITGGNANALGSLNCGGGMHNYNSSPTVTNCTFTGNTADFNGGGMYNNNSSPTVTNCTFSGNTANSGGGGMYNSYNSPTVTNCTFSGNTAGNFGGGGMCNYYYGSPTVTNCTFSGNTVSNGNGGGMYNYQYSSPTVTNCTFSGNTANSGGGGGMYNIYSSPTLTNCTFSGNSAGWGGGGMSNSSSSPTVTNCTFSGNTAGNFGGGMYNGRAMYYDSGSSPTVANCIFWDDTAPSGAEIYNNIGTPTFSHCDIKGSGGSGPLWNPALGVDGGGNIMANPRFVAPFAPAGPDGLWRTNDDGLRLQSDSPCIGAADPAVAPETDILGLPRGSAPDIGAYEFASGGGSYTLTYNAGAGGSISGTTPQTVDYGANGSEVTAVPNTGYRFVRWSDGVMTASRTDTNVTANITVTAMFAHSNPATAKDWSLYE